MMTLDTELARLSEALLDASEAIEDASEDDAQPEDIAEAHWLARVFLDRYHSLMTQLGPAEKIKLQHYFCLKAEQLKKKLGRFKSRYAVGSSNTDRSIERDQL